MEMILAGTVIASVLVVGALISIGNERQRTAMEGVRESLRDWALVDLKIKRAREERCVSVQEPVAWLEEKAGLVLGFLPGIRDSVKVFDHPLALEAETETGRMLVFSPLEPRRLRRICQKNRDPQRLLHAKPDLLGRRPERVPVYELSSLNAGMFFDIELSQVWMQLAGAPLTADRIWMYVVER